MRLLGLILAALAGIFLMIFAPDPFGFRFDAGLGLFVVGAFGLPLAAALRLRVAGSRVLRRIAGLVIILLACASAALLVAVIDYRLLVFRRVDTVAWQEDLQWLETQVALLPGGLREHAQHTMMVDLARLRDDAPTSTEGERLAGLVRATASLQDGHSVAFPFLPATDFTLVPLHIRSFADGWFVVNAATRHRDWIGAEVVTLAGLPAEEAFRRIRPYVSADNDDGARVRAAAYMLSPGFWKAIGETNGPDLHIDLEWSTGSRRRVSVGSTSRLRSLWWHFPPLYLWEQRHPWSLTSLPDRSAVYIVLRAIRHDGSKTLTMLANEALTETRRIRAERLIVDVRGNAGGDNTTFRGFVDAMASSEFNERGRLFVLIDGGTFSAATNFVTAMERRTHALLVGTSTGSGPNHYGDARLVMLPHTRVLLTLSTRYHQFGEATDRRRAHVPHIRTPLSSAEYFSGRDVALDAALMWKDSTIHQR